MAEEQQEPLPSELYRISRAQIEHHDNGVNQRVIWLSIGQSFFFNVYAMLVTAKAPTPELFKKQEMLAVIFPIAALIVSIFTFIDVLAGIFYMRFAANLIINVNFSLERKLSKTAPVKYCCLNC